MLFKLYHLKNFQNANTINIASSVVDTNTTYTASAETQPSGAMFRLTDSTGAQQNINFSQGSNISITRTDASSILIDATNGKVNSGTNSDLAYYASNGTAVSPLTGYLTYNTASTTLSLEGRMFFRNTAVTKGTVEATATALRMSANGRVEIIGGPLSLAGSNSLGGISITTPGITYTSPIQSHNSNVIQLGGTIGSNTVNVSRAYMNIIDAGTNITGGSNPLQVRTHSNAALYTPAINIQRIKGTTYFAPSAIVAGDVIGALRFSTHDGVTNTRTITNVVRSVGVVTITVSAPHGIPTGTAGPMGWHVSVSCSDTTFNVTHAQIIQVPSTTTFTYVVEGPDVASTAATGTIEARNFDVRTGQIRSEVPSTATVSAGIVPGNLRLMVSDVTGTLITGLLINSDQTVYANNTIAINGVSSGLRIGSTNGAGGALITASGTAVALPAGSTVGGVSIGTLTFAGSTANATTRAALTPSSGQVYIQLDDLHGYLWDGSSWVDLGVLQGPAGATGATGAAGPTGATGATGAAGADGADGEAVLNGTGAPGSGLGNDGDFYIDTAAYDIYGPKTAGAWGGPTSLVGPAGSGTGDVNGPMASTDNAIARFDLATGKLLQDSLVTVSDLGEITAPSVGSVIPFYFANQAAFPNATTYHGAIAHSHADGKMYFAHGGIWNALANASEIVADTNTTYSVSAVDGTAGKKIIRLTAGGSGSGTDDVTLVAGTNVTLDRVGDEITINASGGGGGSGLQARQSLAGTTASLSNGATGNLTITGYKSYALLKIQTSAAAWVRLYTDTASRTADASRLEGTDPTPGSGVIAEVITTGAQTILISPGTIGFSNEGTPDTNIPVAVTNKSGGTTTITVTLTAIQLEA